MQRWQSDEERQRRTWLLLFLPMLVLLAVPLLVLTRGTLAVPPGVSAGVYLLVTMAVPLFVTYPVLFFLVPWLIERRGAPRLAEPIRVCTNAASAGYFAFAALTFGRAYVGTVLFAVLFGMAISGMLGVLFESLRLELLRRRGRIR